jgi:ATPase family associated with various cellular activities (AAA)
VNAAVNAAAELSPQDQAQARALESELEWLAVTLERRLQLYFKPLAGVPGGHGSSPWPEPPVLPADSRYGQLVQGLGLDAPERLLLALALAPLLRPQLLDVLHARNDAMQRPYTEFGGISGTPHQGAFVPSGETACFLLAGDHMPSRLAAMRRLLPQGRLARGLLLQLAPAPPGEPVWAGALQLTPSFIDSALPGLVPPQTGGAGAASADGGPGGALPAQRIQTGLGWQDLVLPAATLAQLQDIELWLQHGRTLLDDWGLGRRVGRGYTALFHGPSGTGKTLSACLIGQRCGREVWRVDLSQVVSKYIGETEKNLSRLFDAAQQQGWLLFFDEADALFGKRTAVTDAHDRYANQEVSYLLQRIEAFDGVCILASNLRHHIDDAFSRRFQAVVPFALPKAPERLRLWREGFPARVQLAPALDLERLAQAHELSGGTIMNVVRHACLRALGRGQAPDAAVVQADDVDEGVRRELLKEGRAA